ncbi:cellulase family glycosylhydrolase [Olivibacter sp. SDN3]|uniref:cellulase family glycosylhydrolase n=1 Tax=Olivibacter sp. SDN3 TaxID=2764720 RepID=UPI0016513F56|nr:cellulase family glycosylhydrolase [Olivibacter sp. SDN3]QNL49203.1 cellulase family glycosylhydrolase [Olivibacter sp. SDN3]
MRTMVHTRSDKLFNKMLAILFVFLVTDYLTRPVFGQAQQIPAKRWTKKQAWDWYNKTSWYCGFNYIPAYAINYTAMWDKTSFDPKAIERELALAKKTGMNALRAVLQYAVYEEDPQYFLNTLNTFMDICAKYDIQFMPALFDDCSFGIENDPKTGKQPEPLIGWYAWAWSPSPGHSMVTDTSSYPKLAQYVKTVISHFKDDQRIMLWDLYNEPTNSGLGTTTLPLLQKVIISAREANPSQPISIGVFDQNERLNEIILNNSDIITFHNYGNQENLQKQIEELKKHGRPLINTEWLNRPTGSTIENNLAVFFEEGVGCMLWGLVNGKTQTHLPWGHRPGDPEPSVWQHDLYNGSFKPYRKEEVALIKAYINRAMEKKASEN